MTQEEAIEDGFASINLELERLNAKLERLIDLLGEGLTVHVEMEK